MFVERKKSNRTLKRSRREAFPAGATVFVETAVFVDRDLFEHMKTNFPVDTEREITRFVLAMINAVSTRVYFCLSHHLEASLLLGTLF